MKAKKSTARPPKTIAESQDKYMSKQETAKRAKRREVRFFKAMKKTEHSRKERLDYSFQKHRQLNPSIKNTKKENRKFLFDLIFELLIENAVEAFNESAPKEKLGIETLWVTNFNRFSEIPCDSLPITTTAWEGNCSL